MLSICQAGFLDTTCEPEEGPRAGRRNRVALLRVAQANVSGGSGDAPAIAPQPELAPSGRPLDIAARQCRRRPALGAVLYGPAGRSSQSHRGAPGQGRALDSVNRSRTETA